MGKTTRSNTRKRNAVFSAQQEGMAPNIPNTRARNRSPAPQSRQPRNKAAKSRKNPSYICSNCNNIFGILDHFKKHLMDKEACLAIHPYKCGNCSYIGYKKEDLRNHYSKKPECNHFLREKDVISGLLPEVKKSVMLQEGVHTYDSLTQISSRKVCDNDHFEINDEENASGVSPSHLVKVTSYTMTSKTVDGTSIAVQMNISDVTEGQRGDLLTPPHTQNNSIMPLTLDSFYNKSKTIAQMSENELGSRLFFDCNSHNKLSTYLSTSTLVHDRLEEKGSRADQDEALTESQRVIADQELIIQDLIHKHNYQTARDEDLQERFNQSYFDLDDTSVGATSTTDELTEINDNNEETSLDVRDLQRKMVEKHSQLMLSNYDLMCLDLFHMLRASNAPMSLYDRIISWTKEHTNPTDRSFRKNLLPRKGLITEMNKRLNYENLYCHPRVTPVQLSSGRTTSVVTFSARDLILKIVNNKSLFNKDNILLDINDPFKVPDVGDTIGEVNSGSWHRMAIEHECKKEKDLLMPWTFFIDGLKVDKFGKLTVEAVIGSCLWFKKNVRNRSSAWSVLGFVQDQKLFRDFMSYVRDDKAQDYHDMIGHIFSEFREIRMKGGMKVNLDFGEGVVHDVNIIPVIQFIIGDCKGNDLLCGRKGGHSLKMRGLCRDCNVSPDVGDDTCIDIEGLKCTYHSKSTIEGKTKDELDDISFLHIRNAFSNLSFGGCERNIWGATPAEILHALQLGLCEYIAEAMDNIFTATAMDVISRTLVGIISEGRRQSERDMPNLGPFKLGLMSVKSLKAKERFARVFCVYLALSNSYCIKELSTKKRKRRENESVSEVPRLTTDFLRGFKNVIEETITFHQWLKQDSYPRSDFVDGPNGSDCRALRRIKNFLENYKKFVLRSGNGLKTPKFHQMLHLVDYIIRHGAPSNWDGSRPEYFGKELVKDNAQLTNKQKDSLNFDISKRICEADIIDEISRVFFTQNGRWPSNYCNDIDLMAGISSNGDTSGTSITATDRRQRNNMEKSNARYHICARLKYANNSTDDMDEINVNSVDHLNVHLDWGKKDKIPLLNYPKELQKRLFARLFIGSPNIGGKVLLHEDVTTRIPCHTELKVGSHIFRAHPCYSKKGCWYDWANFRWEGYDAPIPAKIMMIVDLSQTDISYQPEINPNNAEGLDDVNIHKHLTNEVWMIVHAAISSKASTADLSNNHFDSSISQWIKLCPEENLWTVPLSALDGPCYVVRNRDFTKSDNDNIDEIATDDLSAHVIQPMSEWGKAFLPAEL